VFTNLDGTNNSLVDRDATIEKLGLETFTGIDTGFTNLSKVGVAFYLEDDDGEQQLCPGTEELEL